jgi:hypothetical protein
LDHGSSEKDKKFPVVFVIQTYIFRPLLREMMRQKATSNSIRRERALAAILSQKIKSSPFRFLARMDESLAK